MDYSRIWKDDYSVHAMNRDHTISLTPSNQLNETFIENNFEVFKLSNSRSLKLEIKNSLVYLRDYIVGRYGYGINISMTLSNIWELRKLNFLNGSIRVKILEENEGSYPVLFSSSHNCLIISPVIDSSGNKEITKNEDIEFNERGVNNKLRNNAYKYVTKSIFQNPETQQYFYIL